MKHLGITFSSLLVLTACGGGGGGSDTEKKVNPPPQNAAPTVSINSPGSVQEQQEIVLTASASDSDGSISNYSWVQMSGPAMSILYGTSSQDIQFTTPAVSALEPAPTVEFELTVTDDDGATAKDTVSFSIEAINTAPLLSNLTSISVNEQTSATITVDADDVDGEISSYQWSSTSDELVFTVNDQATAVFTTPALTNSTEYSVSVTVTDNEGATSSDNLSVRVNPVVSGQFFSRPASETREQYQTASIIDSENNDEPPYKVEVYDLAGTLIGSGIPEQDGSFSVAVNSSLNNGYIVQSSHLTYTPQYEKNEDGSVKKDEFDQPIPKKDENGNIILEPNWQNDINAVCHAEERNACQVTPLTYLVNRYIEARAQIGEMVTISEENAIIELEKGLNISLAQDPFVEQVDENQSNIDFEQLQQHMQATSMDSVVNSIIGYLLQEETDELELIGSIFLASDTTRLTVNLGAAFDTQAYGKISLSANPKYFGANATAYLTDSMSFEWVLPEGIELVAEELGKETLNIKLPAVEQLTTITIKVIASTERFVEESSVDITISPASAPENTQPNVEDMADLVVSSNQTVTLYSQVIDGQDFASEMTYQWMQIGGETVSILDTTAAHATFNAPVVDSGFIKLQFALTATDSGGKSNSNSIDVYVTETFSYDAMTLNDSGVTSCGNYGFGDNVSEGHLNDQVCAEIESDRYTPLNQDANYGRDATANDASDGIAGFSFTKIAADGTELSDDATEYSCLLDNVTGLMWEVKTEQQGIHFKFETFDYYDSNPATNAGYPGKDADKRAQFCDPNYLNCLTTEEFVAQTNEEGYCGYNDWRMPDGTELLSIVDYSGTNKGKPAISTLFKNAVNKAYFSSTRTGEGGSLAGDVGNQDYQTRKVIVVDFNTGEALHFNASYTGDARLNTRLVRKATQE
ncbi:DUF1566 domain-containing protein [Thalassotalea sp. Y01]|uniref:Lcl C-terminal domain-containing protein n=1 Tax=Thalassotalea sp. Y01 TaxID=2729613 RepID=UPI00145C4068|nr:DUF1566 domain-containing protein [Thalassotalea sp. Y01]NMP14806.1 DUF1566 domain-containing protein [Thalassotalea sp. Y01]